MNDAEVGQQIWWAQKALQTGVVVLLVVLLRHLTLRAVRRVDWARDTDRLAWIVRIRALTLLALVLAVVVVWAAELQTLALSAVAIAAAIVIAGKELIMCLSGGALRRAGDAFRVGDRIEVAGVRGDVIGYGAMTTTVLEVGPGHQRTGRAVILPNSQFLTSAVVNESFTEDYVLHVVAVPLRLDQDWRQAERLLLEAAREVCAPHLEAARSHLGEVSRRHGLSPPSVDPRVVVQLPEPGAVRLLCRFPTLARDRARHEQSLLRAFLERFPHEGGEPR